MRLKISALAAAIAAGTLAGPIAFSQSEEMTPPSSTTEDMQEPTSPGQESAPAEPSAPGEAEPGDMGSTSDEAATPGAAGTAQIDQKKVEQFADAYVQVQTIQQKANAQLESATDPAQADQVKTTAQSDMIAAVERSGLQVEEFNQIVASMAADTELRTRVSAEVQKRINQGSPGAGT
jgi:hypothetical protein